MTTTGDRHEVPCLYVQRVPVQYHNEDNDEDEDEEGNSSPTRPRV
jgi:hypothetical protein